MTIGFRILPPPPRPSAELIGKFRNIAAAHISDNMNRIHAVDAAIRPMHDKSKLVGVAFTVKVPPGDNLMVHKAIDTAQPGDVIMVDAGGSVAQAIIGEIMSTLAAKRGIAGIVIDGAVRDAGALAASPFPVYARGVTHRGPYKNGPGEIGAAVAIGGLVIHPGDIVVGDEDGLVAVPQALAGKVLEAAAALAAAESVVLQSIADGTIDRSWVARALKEKGCEG